MILDISDFRRHELLAGDEPKTASELNFLIREMIKRYLFLLEDENSDTYLGILGALEEVKAAFWNWKMKKETK